jgi:hypothetical protein
VALAGAAGAASLEIARTHSRSAQDLPSTPPHHVAIEAVLPIPSTTSARPRQRGLPFTHGRVPDLR